MPRLCPGSGHNQSPHAKISKSATRSGHFTAKIKAPHATYTTDQSLELLHIPSSGHFYTLSKAASLEAPLPLPLPLPLLVGGLPLPLPLPSQLVVFLL